MVFDFDKLGGGLSVDTVLDPKSIFNALAEKKERYKYLRDVQGEVLRGRFENRF